MPEYKNTGLDTIPDWYLKWCWDEEKLQEHWRSEWKEEGRLYSHVHPGDRFTIGKEKLFDFITSKTFWPDVGEGDTYNYGVDGCTGSSHYIHNSLTDGSFFWIPTIEQLYLVGYQEKAAELSVYIGQRNNPAKLVEEYLQVAQTGTNATLENDWITQIECKKRSRQLGQAMELCGITIDEAENPEKALEREGTEEFYFFHVRIDGNPWKQIDCRTGEWRTFE